MIAAERGIFPDNDQPYFSTKAHYSPELRNTFLAERQFLMELPKFIAPEAIATYGQYDALENHIADLSSTEIARTVMVTYGIRDNQMKPDGYVARLMPILKSGDLAWRHRNLALHTLWLVHGHRFTEDLYPFTEELASKYSPRKIKSVGRRQFLQQAKQNLAYYEDRLFILRHELEISFLLRKLYDPKYEDTFAQYYRLGKYKDREQLERRGCIQTIDINDRIRFQQLQDALEVGRAAAEHFANVDIGKHPWQNPYGKTKPGYTRAGKFFRNNLEDFMRQDRVAEAARIKANNLIDVEAQLLKQTASAVLGNKSKLSGLDKFNRTHKTHYSNSSISDLERKALGESEYSNINRLQVVTRINTVNRLLASKILQEKLGEKLAEILYDYHIAGLKLSEIEETIDIPDYQIGRIKALLERLLDPSHEPQLIHGRITAEQISAWFPDNAIPQVILELVKELTTPFPAVQIAKKLSPEEYSQMDFALRALSLLIKKIVTKAQSQ